MNNNNEVLLKVEHLCQYFKMGSKQLKAVDDVRFEIKKGEVFGLVGESGCGKTTTGRTIIKLYNATSGNVWFKGSRICAGTLSYKEEIKRAREEMRAAVKAYKAEEAKKIAENPQDKESIKSEYAQLIASAKDKYRGVKAKERINIAEANYDNKNCDKNYVKGLLDDLDKEYSAKFAAATTEEESAQLKKEYNDRKRIIKKTKLITKIQMIFQDPIASLNPRMTVREIISEGLIINGIRDKNYIDEKVYEMLETVGLVREHAGRYPHEFSGGQRQRIGIARSVIMQPDMIIADEPISALDVSIQAQVINLLNELRERLGLTILFIAHDLSVVKYFSDRIAVMYFGKIVETASSDELFAHPLHPYTKSLLSAIPLPDPHYEKKRVRVTYNPLAEHDYSVNKPSLREVAPEHFVYCNDEEEIRYKEEIAKKDREKAEKAAKDSSEEVSAAIEEKDEAKAEPAKKTRKKTSVKNSGRKE